MDRPVAGNVNFCPEGIARNQNGLQYISSVTKHEILHAIGFSSSLFPYWHDSNGQPRTERNGLQPPTQAGLTTIRSLTYSGWRTRNGPITHTVTALVTPAVVVGNIKYGPMFGELIVLIPIFITLIGGWSHALWLYFSRRGGA